MTDAQRADRLEEVAGGMRHMAKILRGDAQDLTGRGWWPILCGWLEEAMDVKVITAEQYAAFVEYADRAEGRK